LNIELMTLSEVVDVSGSKGDFTVTLKRSPRYIDMDKCIACGICAEKCPRKVDDEFDMGLGKRKAAYIKYGQTVPLKYAIDEQSCIYLAKGKCRACEKFCPTGAINFEDAQENVTVEVGGLILSPGYQTYDPSGVDFYGYDQIPDVVTSMEYERLLSSSGPCLGHLERPSDNSEPSKIAWIQCVGSRNTNQCDNGYCSSTCCMYAIKQAQVTGEHLQGQSPDEAIFFMDMRTHGKEFERYFEQARDSGIRFVRARPHTILPGPSNRGVELQYVTEDGQMVEEHFDLVVLSVGMEPSEDSKRLAELAGIELNRYGFARTGSFSPVTSTVDGIYVTGAFEAPMAIPEAVTQASTAAMEAAKGLLPAKGSLTSEKSYPQERQVAAAEPRIGVFVCSCGMNIAGTVDVQAVAEYARSLPHVVLVENNLFTCSTDTQDLIGQKIAENDLNRIVIAACTPRTHEPLFQDTLKEAGLNSYLVEMANIRNHNSWVHQKDPERATEKAKDQVRMAVAKAGRNVPLEELEVSVQQQALVVGGGVSGMTAALELADLGFPTVLLERSDKLGGNALHLSKTSAGEDIAPYVQDLIARVQDHQNLELLLQARLLSTTGSVGNFRSEVEADGQKRMIEYGAAVLATGAKEATPREYSYGQDERIRTHLEFDALLSQQPEVFEQDQSVVFIQCVGSRTPERPYCSRICCTHTVEKALKLKELNPRTRVTVLYRDIRTYGLREDLFARAREAGVIFIRFDRDDPPKVSPGDALEVQVIDHILQQPVNIQADHLVLASAIVPHENKELIELYKCGQNEDGFLNEAHPKLRPVDMGVDGLFVAGLCNYPKPMDESIGQAKAAASRAGVMLSRTSMKLDAVKSEVTANCDGCALCLDVCPYGALSLETLPEDQGSSRLVRVDKAVCKGCGLCEATCPKDGIYVQGFTVDQLRAQVDAMLSDVSH
jgi:heterodisulfide reductase subunit A